jgi:hypothetical protein
MSTQDLRALLREAESTRQPVVIRFAQDVPGPGGSSFVAANARLTERHLNWLEQRNPASASRPTYVDVIISHETRQARQRPVRSEPEDSAAQRQRRATDVSRDVAQKADAVTRQAADVYRIVGSDAFTPKALRNKDVQETLQTLNERIGQLHASVHDAIDEYLVGNTLIMDLIARHDLATKTVQHGLSVAVFSTEIASQVLLKGHHIEGSEDEDSEAADERRLQLLRKDLAEIFLGGFMHDCGLWSPETPGESHESCGARLLWNIPEIQTFLPSLTKIVLFHSDIVRIAAKPALVQIIEYPDDPAKVDFRAEFYRTPEDARTSVRFQGDHNRAEILGEADLHKVLPVALAEYCISQSEGFNARSMPEIVSRLAGHANSGLYLRYIVALCNAQVEVIAPRRAYVQLQGQLAFGQRFVDIDGCEGGSLGHADDMYSPHLVLLFGPDQGAGKQRLPFASPHDENFWRPTSDANRRAYVAAGRHREQLALRVTGFMSEDIFNNILGEYEMELRRHKSS